MHVPYKAQIFLVSGRLTYCLPPLFDCLEDLELYPGGSNRRPLRETADKFIEEFFGTDLKVKRVSAVLDAYV